MFAGELPDELKKYLESLKPPPLTADELAALKNHAYPAREHCSYPFAQEWLHLPGRALAMQSVTRGIFYGKEIE